ncbi:ACT domain-containing protein [Microbulbifer hainanensis]|uniref:ACT domain-containing protein n=1 Tax=Microbulbifer hainanensis TaxID=2735675 RepID=UPI0018667C9E|nr:ACT domain-containing protein [Microbulbifer hainanensis]
MNAEVRLEKLLQNIAPHLHGEVYVFCALQSEQLQALVEECLCVFREREGISAILPRAVAEREGLEASRGFCQISLQVYSSLDAVGLTAAVCGELAAAGISANMVAALRHDHVFVPEQDAQRALQLLRGISNRAQYS